MNTTLYTNSSPKPLKSLIPLFLIIFIDSFGYFLIIPVLLRLFIKGDFTIIPADTSMATRNLLYGITIMLSPLASLIAAPVVGHLSDKWGRKKTFLLSLSAALLGYILPIIGILTGQVSLLLLGRFIAGASSSSRPVAQAAVTDFSSGNQKAFYLSMIALAMTLAMVLGPLAGGYLSDHHIVSWFNVMTPYWFAALLAFLNILLLLLFFSDESQQLIKQQKEEPISRTRPKLLKILFNKYVAAFLLIFFLLEIAWSQYYQAIFLYLTHKFNESPTTIGLFTAYIGLWMSLGLTFIYRLLIRSFTVEKILALSLVISTIGFIGLAINGSLLLQWLFVIPTSIFIGTAYPSILTILSNQTAADHQGFVLGAASTTLSLAWLITGLLSGVLINWYLTLPFILAAFCIILTTLLYFIWLKPKMS